MAQELEPFKDFFGLQGQSLPWRSKVIFINLCKIDLLTCIQNLVKLSQQFLNQIIVLPRKFGWMDGRSVRQTVFRTEKPSHRGAPLLKIFRYLRLTIPLAFITAFLIVSLPALGLLMENQKALAVGLNQKEYCLKGQIMDCISSQF